MRGTTTGGWLALGRVRGLTPRALAELLERFGTPDGSARAPRAALDSVPGLAPRALAELAKLGGPDSRRWEQEETARAGRLGARVLTRLQPGYPERLLEGISDPPPAVYIRGSIEATDRHAIAIVGSRRASPYGVEVGRRLAADLAERGYTIVSGLAWGIDAAAHRGALEAGGRTLAVFGCGIDRVYPPAHAALARQIEQSGALVSEFPIGSRPLPPHFPIRNRLISGLSLAVIVVEAAEASGSLITARLAAEQGREVGAVPGPVTSPLSVGTNRLIQDGAGLVRAWPDVIDMLPICCRLRHERKGPEPADLGERARRLLGALSPTAPRHIDVVAGELRESAGNLLADLLDLELRRFVVSLPGMHFLRRS